MIKQKPIIKSPKLSFIIPARNEQETVRSTVQACLDAAGPLHVDQDVIVVSDGSTDDTDSIAKSAGARVIRRDIVPSRAHALNEGVLQCDAQYIFVVDADLLGLATTHLVQIAEPVLNNEADMAIGNLDNIFGRRGFGFVGQRILRREWFPTNDPRLNAYNVDALVNEAVGKRRGVTLSFTMDGVHQRTKFDKFGLYQGAIGEFQEWSKIILDLRHINSVALANYLLRIEQIRNTPLPEKGSALPLTLDHVHTNKNR